MTPRGILGTVVVALALACKSDPASVETPAGSAAEPTPIARPDRRQATTEAEGFMESRRPRFVVPIPLTLSLKAAVLLSPSVMSANLTTASDAQALLPTAVVLVPQMEAPFLPIDPKAPLKPS